MTKRLLVSSILLGLATMLPASALLAQSSDPAQSASDGDKDSKKKETSQLETVLVTGSLIPRAQIETASPVITITAKDLESHGFRNVYDALHTMPLATGSVQDGQVASQGSFAPGATTVSLFGLDPGFTLILLNGHPMADYPQPYNGVQNITDLSTIPVELVDHIDILSGGQSSLYGSSAVAGVINVVLKKKIDGTDFSYRMGGYDNGGGANQRVQLSGGGSSGKLSVTYSVSLENQDPVRQSQTFTPSRLDNPLPNPIAGRDFHYFEPFSGAYVDPGAAACNTSLFGGTLKYYVRPGDGPFCGSYYDSNNTTILNGNKSANGYLNLGYELNDHTEVYGELLYGFSKQLINTGPPVWSFYNQQLKQSANTFSGIIWDNSVQDFETLQRFFAPEEIGGPDANAERILTHQFNVNLGVRGNLGNSNWSYDAYYNRSQINTADAQRWPLTQPFNDYYLGAQQGEDPYGYGIPAYTPNRGNFFKALTPAQFDAMTGLIQSRSLTWQQNVHATVTNTDLFQLPAGSAGIAGIIEAGNQAFNRPVDPRVTAGDFNNITGNQGSGSRNRFAIGGELQLPLLSTLTADLSARYDSYSFAGRTDAKPTYKLGLEFRPIDTLLFRGNYATAFRAPDMLYIFQGPSGLFAGANDYYQCRLQGFTSATIGACPQSAAQGNEAFAFYHGSPDLKDITARTYGIGTVWSPIPQFDIKIDYNHIALSNEVQVPTQDSILLTEANCRLGVSEGGQAFDINSALCQQILSQVVRYPANYPFIQAQGQVQYVTTFPINIANEYLSGIQASSTYRMDLGKNGNLAFSAQYYVELKHKQQQDPGDPYIDLLHNFNSAEFKSRSSASVSWAIDNWTTTLFGTLYGKNVNFIGSGIVGQWAQFNGSVQYDFNGKSSILFSVNNIANRAPPIDTSFFQNSNAVPPPYYNPYVYNGYGRIYWLEFKVHF